MVLTLDDRLLAGPSTDQAPGLVAAAWNASLPTAAEVRRARRRLHAKAVITVSIVAVGYWTAVISDAATWMRFPAAALMVVGLVATATGIMHDANHGALFARRGLNRVAAYTSDLLGGSSWMWRFKHNTLHHGNTNVDGFDTDIAQAPFARLAPDQPWRRWHRHQHRYLWVLYGFMTLKNLLFGEVRNAARGEIGGRPLPKHDGWLIARITAGKLVHIGWAIAIPVLFNPWWKVLLFYLACSWVVGFVLAVTFQLAHCVDGVDFPAADEARRGESFAMHQLRTTADVRSSAPVVSHAFRWLVGGLDHQIEHHLAPRLPHTVYPLVAARFRRRCSEAGVPYRLHRSVWSALCAHARWLRLMGQPTRVA